MIFSIAGIHKTTGAKIPLDGLLDQVALGDRLDFVSLNGALQLHGNARCIRDGVIEVEGEIRGLLRLSCDRCTLDVDVPLLIPISERFVRDLDAEQCDDDVEEYFYSNDKLNLLTMIQDNILLHLPTRVLCSDDCRGLCSVCGADRNKTHCSCQKSEEEDWNKSPLAVLSALLCDDEEV